MITDLSIVNYKNLAAVQIACAQGINFLTGRNGMGKTNVLDAIYYLCVTRSHHTPRDRDVVSFGENFFRLEAGLDHGGRNHDACIRVQPGQIKDVTIDGQTAERLGDHIGFQPVIMQTPDEIALIQGGSVVRRRFADLALCQAGRQYLEALIRYNKLLAQRNALLRRDGQRADRDLLMTFSGRMSAEAAIIHVQRRAWSADLLPGVVNYHEAFSESAQSPAIEYRSHLDEGPLDAQAEASLNDDLARGRTTRGVHRDDIDILLDGREVRRFASQGQTKSVLIALHLALADYLYARTGTRPILLLDDIFDRLDEYRAQRLFTLLAEGGIGQVFVTDTSLSRTLAYMSRAQCPSRTFVVEHGRVHAADDDSALLYNLDAGHDEEE